MVWTIQYEVLFPLNKYKPISQQSISGQGSSWKTAFEIELSVNILSVGTNKDVVVSF